MSIKINSLEIENVKRIKAVTMQPSADGLTVIGGKNNQGKTSVLDSIAWALGGDKFKPSNAVRDGSVIPPYLKITLSNGLIVERKGINSSLKVTDPSGNKNGQQLINEFVSALALDLPKFLSATSKEKANIMLNIIGVKDELAKIEMKENELYNQRHTIGQIADQKAKFAKEMTYYPDVPEEIISASELIRQQQEILARNGENQRKRSLKEKYDKELAEAQIALDNARQRLEVAEQNAMTARKSVSELVDESTEELEKNIADIDRLNTMIRANLDKDKAEEDAKEYSERYAQMSTEINKLREDKTELLNSAGMPLPDLYVEDGELVYKGCKWDCMSASQQMKVAVAIIRKLNPECGFVLMDKLEQMDTETLKEFGDWLESEGLQVIATRVSTGAECSIIIDDGYAVVNKTENNGGMF